MPDANAPNLSPFLPLLSSYADRRGYDSHSETMRQIIYVLGEIRSMNISEENAVLVAMAIVLGELRVSRMSSIMSPQFDALDMPYALNDSPGNMFSEACEWLVRNADNYRWWASVLPIWQRRVSIRRYQVSRLLTKHFALEAQQLRLA